jgi:hypothetical protein
MVKMSRMAQPYATSLRSLATQKATLLLALIVDRVGLPRLVASPATHHSPRSQCYLGHFNCLSKRS